MRRLDALLAAELAADPDDVAYGERIESRLVDDRQFVDKYRVLENDKAAIRRIDARNRAFKVDTKPDFAGLRGTGRFVDFTENGHDHADAQVSHGARVSVDLYRRAVGAEHDAVSNDAAESRDRADRHNINRFDGWRILRCEGIAAAAGSNKRCE